MLCLMSLMGQSRPSHSSAGLTFVCCYPKSDYAELGSGMSALGQMLTHAPQQFRRYSITSSARALTVGGMLSPSAFAVLRLITKSNFVGCMIARSAGFAPLRMRLE